MAVESSIQCCQFEALDVLLGDSLPPQLLPLRRSAVSSLLDFVEVCPWLRKVVVVSLHCTSPGREQM